MTKRPHSGAPHLPRGIRIYAIGDVHGRADLLVEVLAKIDADLAAHPVEQPIHVFLGDYVDRGPASRDVIDKLIDRAYSHESVFLMGNHELMLLEFFRNPKMIEHWRQYGGLETLMSYGVKVPLNLDSTTLKELRNAAHMAIYPAHRSFLNQLIPSFVCGDYFFVHAGVRPNVALETQRKEDLFWIREEFLNHEGNFGKVIVHGHTPVNEPDIRPNRINIDTGAYATGRLTCLILEGDQNWFL